MQVPFVRSVCSVCLAAALLVPAIQSAQPTHAQPDLVRAAIKAGPVGKPIIKGPGATMDLVITVPGVFNPSLLTAQSLSALGQQENNYNAGGDIAPIPVVTLGSKATPAILDVFNAIARNRPNTIILVGVPKGSSLTIINYAVATGAMVYSNLKPGKITSQSAFIKAINDQADYQVPVSIARHKGSRAGSAGTGSVPKFDIPDVALPHSVDNSGDLPPIGNQGDLSNCVAWSTSYYYMTALEGQVHQDWDLSTPGHQFSPAFVYNQVNGGKDDGAYIGDAMQLLQDKGDAPLSLFPEDNRDYTTQPGDSVLSAASAYHIDHFGYLLLNDGDLPYNNDITPLKKVLASGNEFVVGMQVFDSLQNYKGGVYDGPYQGDKDPSGHAMVVVGYDDNAEKTGIGAFLIANSWGADYGEQGYLWISYDDFRQFADDAWAMSLSGASTTAAVSLHPVTATSSAARGSRGAVTTRLGVPAVRYQPSGLFRAAGAAAKPSVTYYSDGSYKLARNPAKKDFIATITFTYERDDAGGNALEQHTYRIKVEAQQANDEVVSQRYRLSDGAVLTAQVDIDTGDQTF